MFKGCKGLELPTFMTDTERLMAIKNIGKDIFCHFPLCIFLGRWVSEGLDGCEVMWTQFCIDMAMVLGCEHLHGRILMKVPHIELLLHAAQPQMLYT
jgi:hypothetical protein